MQRCCRNCVNFHWNKLAQCGNCKITILYSDNTRKMYSSSLFGHTCDEHICQFYKRKEENNGNF